MFYIFKKVHTGQTYVGTDCIEEFDVWVGDTNDNTVEKYSYKQLWEFLTKYSVKIMGVSENCTFKDLYYNVKGYCIYDKAFIDNCLNQCNDLGLVTKFNGGRISVIDYNGKNSVVQIPNGVQVIGKECFKNKDYITKISIPESVLVIEDYAFSGCKSLSSVSVPSGLTYLGNFAFKDCHRLKCTIRLPKSCIYLGLGCFCNCDCIVYIPKMAKFIKNGGTAYKDDFMRVFYPDMFNQDFDRGDFGDVIRY